MFNIEEVEKKAEKPEVVNKKRLAKLKGAFRRNWGGVKPFERIHRVDTAYDRRKFNSFSLTGEE